MKLSLKSLLSRAFRETHLRPLPTMPTEDGMYLADLRRKAADEPRNHVNHERQIF